MLLQCFGLTSCEIVALAEGPWCMHFRVLVPWGTARLAHSFRTRTESCEKEKKVSTTNKIVRLRATVSCLIDSVR